ncbi:MAG: hypothetical protein NZ704_15410, partial [Geminicoccaceae bacterium]|nr:hypothetical protein [Geminicoccaceae bacterium]
IAEQLKNDVGVLHIRADGRLETHAEMLERVKEKITPENASQLLLPGLEDDVALARRIRKVAYRKT